MQTLFEVHSDHPIAKRVDEYQLTKVESNDLMAELEKSGYDNIKRSASIFLEEGDTVIITESMVQAANKVAKEQIDYMFNGDFPIQGKLTSERTNRFCGHLIVDWETPMSHEWGIDTHTTNTYWLSNKDNGFGLKFIQPEFEELPTINCPDKYLFEAELVEKYYALQNNISIEEAEKAIERVQSAMAKSEIIFYRP